jgi:hypothetical protein
MEERGYRIGSSWTGEEGDGYGEWGRGGREEGV